MPGKGKKNELPGKYRQWMDLVEYIITKEERSTFFKLTNDRDRDVFISLFWNLRDPTPGTEENQFKEGHIRRFQYADKYFKFGSPRKGWKTDMGRIYIILGEPSSKDRYDMGSTVLPAQIWSYYGKKRPGLPPSFRVVFWKKHGMGEYKIYEPASDGPFSLLRKTKETTGLDPTNVQASYQLIQREHPALAEASLTLIPDDIPYNFIPSLRSRQLLGKLIESPREHINDTYATNFLKYKGKVEVDYSINYIESRHRAFVLKDPRTGLNFVHFAIRPRNLSVHSSGEDNRYFFNFELVVSLHKQKGNQPVFEYRKKFPFSGERDEVLQKFFNSLIISDFFPVAEGDYRLSVLLQNHVNKEFTYFDTDISIPTGTQPKPVISGLLISKEVKTIDRQVFIPFKLGSMEVNPDPRKEFGSKDKIFAVFSVDPGNYSRRIKGMIEVQAIVETEKYKKQYSFEIAADNTVKTQTKSFSRELEFMAPGYYSLAVRLFSDDGTLLDEKKEQFTISFRQHIPDTTTISRAVSFGNRFLYYHILGLQYMRLNKLEKAETMLNKAFNLRPDYGNLVKDFCVLLLKRKHSDRVLEIVEHLKSGQKDQFDYFALRGKAFFQKGRYKSAIENLSKANRVYDSDVSVLNYLGFSYLMRGNKKEARRLFSASLRLDDQQKNIAAILKDID